MLTGGKSLPSELQGFASIGAFIREKVIPPGMSVKAAAHRLDVGRVALSSLLNGRASLSREMAVRLAKAFGVDGNELLKKQELLDRSSRLQEEKSVAVRSYVPGFLTIKARHVHDWARQIHARQLLPVLLRKLVHSTGHDLRRVDFPGYDNAERIGWDGTVEAGAATAWIPEGLSVWEFGTSENPGRKARADYKARLKSTPHATRRDHTFVFVTPRTWSGKVKWAEKVNSQGQWKAVRALDASDIEQWLEESIPAQIWFGEQLGHPTTGVEIIDQSWRRWSKASDPPMVPAIFEPALTRHLGTLEAWLSKKTTQPFVVAADSKEEALAFLACLFDRLPRTAVEKDLPAVFHSPEILRSLAQSSTPFIPIAYTLDVEKELATVFQKVHCIVVRPRNAVDREPDIALDPLGPEAFTKAMAAMGLEERAERLGRESGRSPTILRRRLSKIDAIRNPGWASNPGTARALIPMALVGAWHAESAGDQEVLGTLADCPYEDIERDIARLFQLDDSPMWSVDQYRGVASKLDALFAASRYVTVKDLKDFILLSGFVLSEDDPAFDLPGDRRWMANIYGKVRQHSATLRKGVCETLVILSIHGNDLFQHRLGIDVEALVGRLIRDVLTPLTSEKIYSQKDDLPRYAEAAPREFLGILEADLEKEHPASLELLKPADHGPFGGCPRTGLLWALECLAWNPRDLPRVCRILARLSQVKIQDNWANTPLGSLEAIFRAWMPQTAAPVEERIKTLESLVSRYPDIAWRICMNQIRTGPSFGHPSFKPHWRSDAAGAGQPVPDAESMQFRLKTLKLALAWARHDAQTLGDLVERLHGIPVEDQLSVWHRIRSWSEKAPEPEKATLRERIRRYAFTRRGRRIDLEEITRQKASEAYSALEPRDPVLRHAWLFASAWVEESAEELEDEELDYKKRDERIHALRTATIRTIVAQRGTEGLVALLAQKAHAHTVGYYAALAIPDAEERLGVLRFLIGPEPSNKGQVDEFLRGFLRAMEPTPREEALSAIMGDATPGTVVRLLLAAPFSGDTWREVSRLGNEVSGHYWREVNPRLEKFSASEANELVDRLLEVERPRAAFQTVHLDWSQVETSRLTRLLRAVASVDKEPTSAYRLEGWDISSALDSLDARSDIGSTEMAELEFLFLSVLQHSQHGIPNLERELAKSPAFFVQVLALATNRKDGGQDPPEYQIDDPERRARVSTKAYELLSQLRRIPGRKEDGAFSPEKLRDWLTEVRKLCAQCGRLEVGDRQIGELLSKSPREEDGTWPCKVVCEAMEGIASRDLAGGFIIGTRNSREVHFRGEGGAQERELAAKYRNWSRQLSPDYRFVSEVLEEIAVDYEHEGEWHDSRSRVRRRLWE